MTEFDLTQARARFTRQSRPNSLALVMVVDNLREWTNEHSDGWGYWPKPMYAAGGAMLLIDFRTWRERPDITDEDVRAAVRPIKAFLTRQSKLQDYRGRPMVTKDDRERILRSVADI